MITSTDTPPAAIDQLYCEYLLQAWNKGWFKNYSKNHFLIRALQGEIEAFNGYINMLETSSGPFPHSLDTICSSFCLALSCSLAFFENQFSEKVVKDFMIEKLSGGKANYFEDQFFRALSELTVIKWFCIYTRGKNINENIYEPILSGQRRPEARFIRDDIVIDVEVKTPGFIPKDNIKPKITPIILINDDGRRKLQERCFADDIEFRLPDINKLKQHLNDAAKKFVVPEHKKHFNVVYINWTYCDYPQYAFLEPFSLLMNDRNGVFRNKNVGKIFGFNEEVYEKITAIVVYNENIEGFVKITSI